MSISSKPALPDQYTCNGTPKCCAITPNDAIHFIRDPKPPTGRIATIEDGKLVGVKETVVLVSDIFINSSKKIYCYTYIIKTTHYNLK